MSFRTCETCKKPIATQQDRYHSEPHQMAIVCVYRGPSDGLKLTSITQPSNLDQRLGH